MQLLVRPASDQSQVGFWLGHTCSFINYIQGKTRDCQGALGLNLFVIMQLSKGTCQYCDIEHSCNVGSITLFVMPVPVIYGTTFLPQSDVPRFQVLHPTSLEQDSMQEDFGKDLPDLRENADIPNYRS